METDTRHSVHDQFSPDPEPLPPGPASQSNAQSGAELHPTALVIRDASVDNKPLLPTAERSLFFSLKSRLSGNPKERPQSEQAIRLASESSLALAISLIRPESIIQRALAIDPRHSEPIIQRAFKIRFAVSEFLNRVQSIESPKISRRSKPLGMQLRNQSARPNHLEGNGQASDRQVWTGRSQSESLMKRLTRIPPPSVKP